MEEFQGWIKLWRKSQRSAVFTNPLLWKLWTYCLMKANHKEYWIEGNGITPILLKPGQFICSKATLADALNCNSRKKFKLSQSQWWRYLELLQKLGNVNIKTTNRFTIVTILNWDRYQARDKEDEHYYEHQMNGKEIIDEQQMDTNKNENNDENGKKSNHCEDANTIFAFWLWLMEKNGNRTKFTSDRQNKVKARLKRYSKEDIMWAICGCGASKFHQGDNDEKKIYNDLTLVCRSDAKLEQFQGYIDQKRAEQCIQRFLKDRNG